MQLDEKYQQILEMLKKDSQLTATQIGKQLRTPASTVHNRIKKLETDGIIERYTVRINYEKLGKSLLAYILLKLGPAQGAPAVRQEEVARQIKKLGADEVCSVLVDEADMLVALRSKDLYEIKQFAQRLREIAGVVRTHTFVVLNQL